jgi:2-polyprenyl-3-methyl-5-hydroxy-6-metoxy-1,4-benzoquinol methylase
VLVLAAYCLLIAAYCSMVTPRVFIRKVIRRLRPRPRPGDTFRAAALRRYEVDTDRVEDPTVQMWIDFTLSSVDRGRQAVLSMGGVEAFAGRKVFDVGCAYGGFLVAAKEAGAGRVVGVDIDSTLIDLARLQLTDHHVSGELAVEDITSDGLVDRWGTFDIVLCNDVIEHVVDPLRCAANLASVMKKGGKVFLEIPNGSAVDFMRKDGHYGLFGLTLLGRSEAERWWRFYFHDTYGVEHYAPLSYYLGIFSASGISLRLLTAIENPERRMEEIGEAFDRLEGELASLDKPEAVDLVASIQRRGREEIGRFRQLRARLESSDLAAERSILLDEIISTYGMTFWTLEGTKL